MTKAGFYKGLFLLGLAYIFAMFYGTEVKRGKRFINIYDSKVIEQDCKFKDSVFSSVSVGSVGNVCYGFSNLQKDFEKLFNRPSTNYSENNQSLPIQSKKIGDLLYTVVNIKSNFYVDARRAMIPNKIILQVVNVYRNLINFRSDLRSQDKMAVMYSEKGELKYAAIYTKRGIFKIYGYKGYFYDSRGTIVSSEEFKRPIRGARISSRFGRRIHPIYGYSRKHKGIDFAAPCGTPIGAASSGKIVQIGRLGGYGKCVTILHENGYKTRYGHMSKFNNNLYIGSVVKQGQIIGFVGMTGVATGAHLHYEVITHRGTHIDPMTVTFVSKEIDRKTQKQLALNKGQIDDKVLRFKKLLQNSPTI